MPGHYKKTANQSAFWCSHAFTICTSPIIHLVCITFTFLSSWVLQPSQGKLKTMVMQNLGGANKCLLLAEFSVRTVNYGPSFFASIYGPSVKRAGHKSMEKKRGSVIYSTDRRNEANKMFIIWLLPVSGTGNKCRTHDLTVIWQVSKKKVFIGARKQ